MKGNIAKFVSTQYNNLGEKVSVTRYIDVTTGQFISRNSSEFRNLYRYENGELDWATLTADCCPDEIVSSGNYWQLENGGYWLLEGGGFWSLP